MQIVETFLIGLATYAWLCWLHEGGVRQWLSALFPNEWRAGTMRRDVATMCRDTYEEWLCLEAECPCWMRKLLLCHFCISFHVSLWLWILTWVLGANLTPFFPIYVFASAGIGLHLYKK